MGGSPGLVVMVDNSCSKGHGFKSWRHILDGHFSHWFVAKIVLFTWKYQNTLKIGRAWPIFKKNITTVYHFLALFMGCWVVEWLVLWQCQQNGNKNLLSKDQSWRPHWRPRLWPPCPPDRSRGSELGSRQPGREEPMSIVLQLETNFFPWYFFLNFLFNSGGSNFYLNLWWPNCAYAHWWKNLSTSHA